jgi:hypothetical protein
MKGRILRMRSIEFVGCRFADIVDDTGDGVRQRLGGDAALGPIIVQASEARMIGSTRAQR